MTDANDHSPQDGLSVRDLGPMAYGPALRVQRQTHQHVLEGEAPPTLLLVEHEPVITISRRKGTKRNLLADLEQLSKLGIDVQETDRGGDVTYHGPGQLVAYPIVHLAPLRLNIGQYMRRLEQIAIDTVAKFGVRAGRCEGCPGVWIHGSPPAKICALGVRVRRNVTMHGMALNVMTDLSHYNTIVPCGLAHKGVTSLLRLLADHVPTMDAVKAELIGQARRHLNVCAPAETLTATP